jgi:hypothetical protein
MEATAPENPGLSSFLRKIADLLDAGDAVEAARVVGEMNLLLPTMPVDIPDVELSEAEGLLKRCRDLEQGLRRKTLDSMQRLGAVRKSLVYRRRSPYR